MEMSFFGPHTVTLCPCPCFGKSEEGLGTDEHFAGSSQTNRHHAPVLLNYELCPPFLAQCLFACYARHGLVVKGFTGSDDTEIVCTGELRHALLLAAATEGFVRLESKDESLTTLMPPPLGRRLTHGFSD